MSVTARFLIAAALVVSACGSGSDDRSDAGSADGDFAQSRGAVVANTHGTITTAGSQRVMTAILGPDTKPFLGGPDLPVSIAFRPTEGGPALEVDGTWLSTNATDLGLYVSVVDFPVAGSWDVILSTGEAEVARTSLQVADDSPVPSIGDLAPATDTPTATGLDRIHAISTDPEPDPAFYQLSIADAVDNGRPTVIAFVTPGLCQTALCGPTLEAVKGAAAGRDDLDVVHVEPFDLELATTGELRPIAAMSQWGLQTEPWVFIVGADGTIRASFEGIIGQHELETALDQVSSSP